MNKSIQCMEEMVEMLEALDASDRDVTDLAICSRKQDNAENERNTGVSMKKRIFYNSHKGFVLVIVNHKFRPPLHTLDRGREIDEIPKLFSTHGYKFKTYTNLDKDTILSKVKSFARTKNLDRFICFLSSHGNETSLACPDGKLVPINDILRAADTDQLKDMPKVFFIDACRTLGLQDKDNPSARRPVAPSTEYFIGYSCLPYTKSRAPIGKNSCGIFFKTLVEVFEDSFWRPPIEASKRRNIHDLMEKVQYRVNKYKDIEGNTCQISIYEPTLTGELFLHGYGEKLPKTTELLKETENLRETHRKYQEETKEKCMDENDMEYQRETRNTFMAKTDMRYQEETKKTFMDENDMEYQRETRNTFMAKTDMRYPEETKKTFMDEIDIKYQMETRNTFKAKTDLKYPEETKKTFMDENDIEYQKKTRKKFMAKTDLKYPEETKKTFMDENDMEYQKKTRKKFRAKTEMRYPEETKKTFMDENDMEYQGETRKKFMAKTDIKYPEETKKTFMDENDMKYQRETRKKFMAKTDIEYLWKTNQKIASETDMKYQIETPMEYSNKTKKRRRKKKVMNYSEETKNKDMVCLEEAEKRYPKTDMVYTDKSRKRVIQDKSNVCVFL